MDDLTFLKVPHHAHKRYVVLEQREPTARKKGESQEGEIKHKIKIYLTSAGILMEGGYAQITPLLLLKTT